MLRFHKALLTIALILYSCLVKSQDQCSLLFQHNNDTIKEWQSRLQQKGLAAIQTFKGEFAEQKKWLYQEKLRSVLEHFDKPELVTDTAANNYIAAVMSKLTPALKAFAPQEINVYISRTGIPNAFTPGFHSVFINAGLLTRVQNEAQLAFVLCHEMAHIFLKHGEEAADQYLSSIQSKEFKQKVAAIKKQEFGQGRAIEELFKKFSFDSRRHSRFKETAADSLAIVWLSQTAYSLGQVISCLEVLDSIDTDRCDTKKVFEQYLNAEEYPVKAGYFGTTRRSVFGAAAYDDDTESLKMKDSLRTHPDCRQRIAYAGTLIPEAARNTGSKFLIDTARLYNLQQRLSNEVIEFALSHEKTSRGFFYAVEQLAAGDRNAFVASGISRSLNQLHQAQKVHTLGRITDLPNPQFYTKAYNELLYFIQNATLTDLAKINYYFTGSALKKYPGCKELAGSMAACAGNAGKAEEAAYWKKIYDQQ
ncbi:MAG: M48 family metalloprotease [Chitinophagaceae bacterium]|nr:M48 family metalloprotease [Chitinophagaceae bacterium]